MSTNDTSDLLARVAAAQKDNPGLSEAEILTQLLLNNLHEQDDTKTLSKPDLTSIEEPLSNPQTKTHKNDSNATETLDSVDITENTNTSSENVPADAPAQDSLHASEEPTDFADFFDMGKISNPEELNTTNTTEVSEPIFSQETTPRPPHVSRWTIQHDEEDGLPTIVFYTGDNHNPVCYIQITVDNFESMLNQLNQIIIIPGESPITNWHIITPEGVPGAIEKPSPILSLMSHGALVASMELDKAKVKKIVPRLLKIYNPAEEEGFVNKFNKFIARNKTIAIIAGALIGIVTLGGLFTLIN